MAEPSGKVISIHLLSASECPSNLRFYFFLQNSEDMSYFSLLSVSALKFTDSFVGSLVYDKLLSMAAPTVVVIDF